MNTPFANNADNPFFNAVEDEIQRHIAEYKLELNQLMYADAYRGPVKPSSRVSRAWFHVKVYFANLWDALCGRTPYDNYDY